MVVHRSRRFSSPQSRSTAPSRGRRAGRQARRWRSRCCWPARLRRDRLTDPRAGCDAVIEAAAFVDAAAALLAPATDSTVWPGHWRFSASRARSRRVVISRGECLRMRACNQTRCSSCAVASPARNEVAPADRPRNPCATGSPRCRQRHSRASSVSRPAYAAVGRAWGSGWTSDRSGSQHGWRG